MNWEYLLRLFQNGKITVLAPMFLYLPKSSDDKKNIMIKVTQQNGKENIIKVPFKFVKFGLNIGNMFGLSKDISDKIATLAENDMTDIVNIDTENGEHIAITLD